MKNKIAINFKIVKIQGTEGEITELIKIFEETPDYFYRCGGSPQYEAGTFFKDLPKSKSLEDKYIFGIYFENKMIGCADIIKDYPDDRTAWIGLLLLSEKHQNKGSGTMAYKKLEEYIRNWNSCDKIKIGIVLTNDIVIPFWEKQGFTDTKIRKPWLQEKIRTEVAVFEKQL